MTMQTQCREGHNAASAPLPAFSPGTLLQVLWVRAHSHLTPRELRWIAEGVPDFTFTYTRQLECVMEGVGCLIASDGKGMAGVLQSDQDVPDLLFSQATHMSLIAGMSMICGNAGSLLKP